MSGQPELPTSNCYGNIWHHHLFFATRYINQKILRTIENALFVYHIKVFFRLSGGSSGVYLCILITSLCSYMLAAIFCVFILTFEKEYEYFSEVCIASLSK